MWLLYCNVDYVLVVCCMLWYLPAVGLLHLCLVRMHSKHLGEYGVHLWATNDGVGPVDLANTQGFVFILQARA